MIIQYFIGTSYGFAEKVPIYRNTWRFHDVATYVHSCLLKELKELSLS
jgi:hypothetical protein